MPGTKQSFTESTDGFRRLPPGDHKDFDQVQRSVLLGTSAGATTFIVGSQVIDEAPGTFVDEGSALAVAAGFAIIGAMKSVRRLCEDPNDLGKEKLHNYIKGLVGSFNIGAAISALVPGGLIGTATEIASSASLIAIDFGIVGLSLALGLGYGRYRNTKYSQKACPHCQKPSECKNRFCPHCKRIFYPSAQSYDCAKNPYLSWFQVASHLQSLHLTYDEAAELARK